MPDNNIYISIEFHKRRSLSKDSKDLTIDETHEAFEMSMRYVELLTFFSTQAAQSNELDFDSKEVYFIGIRELIQQFMFSASENMNELMSRIENLEKVVIPKTKNQ